MKYRFRLKGNRKDLTESFLDYCLKKKLTVCLLFALAVLIAVLIYRLGGDGYADILKIEDNRVVAIDMKKME